MKRHVVLVQTGPGAGRSRRRFPFRLGGSRTGSVRQDNRISARARCVALLEPAQCHRGEWDSHQNNQEDGRCLMLLKSGICLCVILLPFLCLDDVRKPSSITARVHAAETENKVKSSKERRIKYPDRLVLAAKANPSDVRQCLFTFMTHGVPGVSALNVVEDLAKISAFTHEGKFDHALFHKTIGNLHHLGGRGGTWSDALKKQGIPQPDHRVAIKLATLGYDVYGSEKNREKYLGRLRQISKTEIALWTNWQALAWQESSIDAVFEIVLNDELFPDEVFDTAAFEATVSRLQKEKAVGRGKGKRSGKTDKSNC
jgi:hypothetical protein